MANTRRQHDNYSVQAYSSRAQRRLCPSSILVKPDGTRPSSDDCTVAPLNIMSAARGQAEFPWRLFFLFASRIKRMKEAV